MNKTTYNPALEDSYPFIIGDLMVYIERIKKLDKSSALLDIIMDYSIKNGFEPELVGDAIANDVYLKSFVEKDCRAHGFFGFNKQETEELVGW
jgi:hypothetical protein